MHLAALPSEQRQNRTISPHPQGTGYPATPPLNLDASKRITETFIEHYDQVGLHRAIGYIAPADRLANRHRSIFRQRDLELETARKIRKLKSQQLVTAIA